MEEPGATAIILRRTFPELSKIIRDSRALISSDIATYKTKDYTWEFKKNGPNGKSRTCALVTCTWITTSTNTRAMNLTGSGSMKDPLLTSASQLPSLALAPHCPMDGRVFDLRRTPAMSGTVL